MIYSPKVAMQLSQLLAPVPSKSPAIKSSLSSGSDSVHSQSYGVPSCRSGSEM